MKSINYVYIITNLINSKQYVGDHIDYSKLLKDNYFGSGKLIRKAIKKYGKQNFKKEILEQFSTKEEAFNAQEKYIQQYNTLQPSGYNISPKGGNQVYNGMSEEGRKRLSEFHKGKKVLEETKKRLSESLKLAYKENRKNKITSEITKEKLRQINLGKKLSNETKLKMKISQTGKKLSNETKLKMSLAAMGNKNGLNNKSWLGKKLSEEHKAKLRKPKRNKIIKLTN
jgi:group I intron endonuclease